MYVRNSRKPKVIVIILLSLAVVCGGFFYIRNIDAEIEAYEISKAGSDLFFSAYVGNPYVNTGVYDNSFVPAVSRDDALYTFSAPEGFTIISHSPSWDNHKLQMLYAELKQNRHGEEIEKLYEIVIYPDDDSELNAAATYSPGITTVSFHLIFPALPYNFSVDFPVFTGRINIYGGDTNTTIESIAGGLSHEYGHHYTFYYMFDYERRQQGRLDETRYGYLRGAYNVNFDLIPTVEMGADYLQNRFRYIIETAAEDYVVLMGSPTTRQIEDYYDVRQLVENPELSGDRHGERNAFPQENMLIPLATHLPELCDYYYSFIGREYPSPAEEWQSIDFEIARHSESFDLVSGPQTYVYYTLTWTIPYPDAVYTLACFDPVGYTGYGIPVKTVRPESRSGNTSTASATIGEFAVRRGNMIHSTNDELASGVKVFYVVAQLPDGTYYTSDLYEVNFG